MAYTKAALRTEGGVDIAESYQEAVEQYYSGCGNQKWCWVYLINQWFDQTDQ